MTLSEEAIQYAAKYAYFDVAQTITEIDLREQITGCDDNRRALMNAYRRVKRQLTSCGFEKTDELIEDIKANRRLEWFR